MGDSSQDQRRNLVICCDGTANEFREHNTNVVRLYQVLVRDPVRQVAAYHPGVGTIEAVGALTSTARKVTTLLGKVFGYGLEADLRDLYVCLMQNHRPGDRVFLFGFSRGAYTVRALVGLLQYYGLMDPWNEPLVPYAIRRLVAAHKELESDPAAEKAVFEVAARFRATFGTRVCKPHFVGIWDTVSSVGWIANPLRVMGTANSPNVAIARHALALDERRSFFRTNRWTSISHPPGGAHGDLKEVWFAGVHSDVGGGYEESPKDLWKFSLDWMLREAEAAGLLVDPALRARVLGAAADPNVDRNESMTGLWRLAEFVPKRVSEKDAQGNWDKHWRMNLFRPRQPRAGDRVHWSVMQRDGYAGRVVNPVIEL